MNAKLVYRDDREKKLSGLNWLLKNYRSVEYFVVDEIPKGIRLRAMVRESSPIFWYEIHSTANFMQAWLQRPSFQGKSIIWFGSALIVGDTLKRKSILRESGEISMPAFYNEVRLRNVPPTR